MEKNTFNQRLILKKKANVDISYPNETTSKIKTTRVKQTTRENRENRLKKSANKSDSKFANRSANRSANKSATRAAARNKVDQQSEFKKMKKTESHQCPVKEAMKFLSGAWTLEIYWYLRQGPLRFGELIRSLETVSAKVLTQRLRELEEKKIIKRKVIVESAPPQVEYSLTELGRKFLPAIDSIAEIGKKLLKIS